MTRDADAVAQPLVVHILSNVDIVGMSQSVLEAFKHPQLKDNVRARSEKYGIGGNKITTAGYLRRLVNEGVHPRVEEEAGAAAAGPVAEGASMHA